MKKENEKQVYTTGFGSPVDNDQNSKTAGSPGPVLIQDTHLLEKLGHFNLICPPKTVPAKVRFLWDNDTLTGGLFHEEFTVHGGASSFCHEAG